MFNLLLCLLSIAYTLGLAAILILISSISVRVVIENYNEDMDNPYYQNRGLKPWQYVFVAVIFVTLAFVMTGFIWLAGIKLFIWLGGL
ncbi:MULTISPECIES: hypothetical protein [Lactobacillus]|uniref:hypothetical protein n=1 Tax=Lactobacillus TaxID=1578 RepID=UPI00065E3B57|nr:MULTISPECIES: hypothetical protein [Lactobacillus]OEH66153.1 hypothetical protein BFX48_02185 [Lactobacillus jensenii]